MRVVAPALGPPCTRASICPWGCGVTGAAGRPSHCRGIRHPGLDRPDPASPISAPSVVPPQVETHAYELVYGAFLVPLHFTTQRPKVLRLTPAFAFAFAFAFASAYNECI